MFVGEFPQNNTLSPSPKIIGCPKNCPKMKEFIQYLEIINSNDDCDDINNPLTQKICLDTYL